jgi:hypothetical protein
MHYRLAGLVAVLILAAAPGATLAKSMAKGFTGNVCELVTGSEATAVHGASSRCAKSPPAVGPGSKIFTANWPSKNTGGPLESLAKAIAGRL